MGKPLFVPLKSEYFFAFANGSKGTEYRQYGPRWNEKTCWVGRSVTLSHGYGKGLRLCGIITAFRKVPVLKSKGGAAYLLCYGTSAIGPIAEIDIQVIREESPALKNIEGGRHFAQQPQPETVRRCNTCGINCNSRMRESVCVKGYLF